MRKNLILMCVFTVFLWLSISAESQYNFISGTDWERISKSNYSPIVKSRIKTLMLKSVLEASMMTGKPIISPTETNFAPYIAYIDEYYSDSSNSKMPIVYALKLAGLKKQGLPAPQLKIYNASMKQKLNLKI